MHERFRTALNGHIDVKSAAGASLQRSGGKVRVQPVPGGDGFDDGEEGNGVVRGGQGIGIAEIHLVLAGAFLVVRGFRLNAHPLQRQADLPADIFTSVLRRDIHIGGLIIRNVRDLAVFVQPEQVEFQLGAEGEGVARLRGVGNGLLENAPGIVGKGRAVRMGDGAEHPHHAPVLRPPWQQGNGGSVGMEKQVGIHLVAEARDGGSVDGNAVLEGAFQLVGHDGDILGSAEAVAERKADELHVLLLNELYDLLRRIFHTATNLPARYAVKFKQMKSD